MDAIQRQKAHALKWLVSLFITYKGLPIRRVLPLSTIMYVLMLIAVTTKAQEPVRNTSLPVHFKVIGGYHIGDSSFIIIDGGSAFGLKKGTHAYVYSKQLKRNYTVIRPTTNIGFGSVLRVFPDSSVCYMVQIGNKVHNDSILIGDLMQTFISVPEYVNAPLIRDLAMWNIFFRNSDKKYFYTLKDVLNGSGPAFQESIVDRMAGDIKVYYNWVKDQKIDSSYYRPVRYEGRFEGQVPMDVLKVVTPTDVYNFLLYISSFPADYMGQDFNFGPLYLYWIKSGAYYSTKEVLNALYNKDEQELTRLLPLYNSSIRAAKMINKFCDSLSEYSGRNKVKADGFLKMLLGITNVNKDTSGKAMIYYTLAGSWYDNGYYKQSLEYINVAVYYAGISGNHETELSSYLRKSEILAMLNRTQESIAFLDTLQVKTELYKNAISIKDYGFYRQMHFQYKGWVYYRAKIYSEALKNYSQASTLNYELNTLSARENNALVFKNLGLIYVAQGRDSLAREHLFQSKRIYDSLKESTKSALVCNEIGISYHHSGEYRLALKYLDTAYNNLDTLSLSAGISLSTKGNCYSALGDFDSAIIFHKKSIRIRPKIHLETAKAWDDLAWIYRINGYKELALNSYDSSRRIYMRLGDSAVNLTNNYYYTGQVYHADENYKKAIGCYDSAQKYSRELNPFALYNIGNAWAEVDQEKAEPYLVQCEQKSEKNKDFVQQYDALGSLMLLAYRQGDYKKGDEFYLKARLLLKDIYSREREAKLFSWKGTLYSYKSQVDSSIYYYKKAQKIFDTVNLNESVWARVNLSKAYITKGAFLTSEKLLRDALSISRKIESAVGEGECLVTLSFIYSQQGELKRAMALTDTAAPIYEKSGNNVRLAGVYMMRGLIYRSMGKYKTALENMFACDSLYQVEGTEDYRSSSLNNIGVVYFYQGDYEKSIEYCLKTDKYYKPGDSTEAYLLKLGNTAESYYYQHKLPEAKKILENIYPIAIKKGYLRNGAGYGITLGKIYVDEGEYAKAKPYFQKALELSKNATQESEIDAFVYLGKIDAANNNIKAAEISIRKAQKIGDAKGLFFINWIPYYELGLIFYKQGLYDSAINNFKKAIDIVEMNASNVYGDAEAGKIYYSDSRQVDLYSKIISSFRMVKNDDMAFQYTVRNSRTAVDSKIGADARKIDDTLQAVYRESSEKKGEITAVDISISKARTAEERTELIRKRTILEQGYQDYIDRLPDETKARLRTNPEGFSDYKGVIPADMVVVFYVMLEKGLAAFIVTRDSLQVREYTFNEDINVLINEFISALSNPGKGTGTGSMTVRAEIVGERDKTSKSFVEISSKLYGLLINDLQGILEGKENLCIIPSGKLTNIPFGCLGKLDANGKFHFLAEEKNVFYTNKLDFFKEQRTTDHNLTEMAAFGNPDKSLEFAKTEVLDIQKVSKTSDIFLEASATESQAKKSLSHNKYIHFATHGTLDYANPKQSFLTFSSDPGDDGRLTISEIDSMEVRSDYYEMVTLSACETATPLQISKDWIVSPANSFLRKKFKTVVASLWKVNDEATGILMTEFYKNLATMDKIKALRMAQVKLSNNPKYEHPFYWGGFVLYGDWR